MKGEWSIVSMTCGAESVTMVGTLTMLTQSVLNWE